LSVISTTKIVEAISHYQSLGYQLIDAPMCVDLDVSSHTKPIHIKDIYHNEKEVYVGSAEQSFIQLHKDKKIKNGMFMALTPCLRDEKILDNTHYKSFLKLELIIIGNSNSFKVINDVKEFFEKYLKVKTIKTNEATDSVDIVSIKGEQELGSYGVRHMLDGTTYTYGTGIAEPRLSFTISIQ